jgi:hypothetical protein
MTPLLRVIIGFDLLMTAWLAIPGLSDWFIQLIDRIGVITGWAAPLAPFDPFAMFMVNLAGVLGVAWNWARWRSASYELAKLDAAARLAVAALILYYVFVLGVTPVILLFVISEVFGSLVELRLQPLETRT